MSAYFDLARDEFEDVAEPGCVVALHRELDVDLAPLDAYTALRDGHAFLLESAEKHVSAFREVDGDGGAGDRARYSFVGFEPDAVVEIDGRAVDVERLRDDAAATLRSRRTETAEADDALDALRDSLPDVEPRNFRSEGRQVFTGGLVGVLGYDVVHDVWLDGAGSRSTAPDAVYVVSTRNLTFDHDADAVTLVFTPVVDGETDSLEVYDACVEAGRRAEDRLEAYDSRSSQPFVVHDERAGDRDSYVDAVETARDHVYDGDVYQAVVSRKRAYDVEGDPRDYYEALRDVNPSPYMYLLEYGDHAVVGSSPETLVSVHGDRVTTNPIAGTCGRGATPVEDRRLAGEMLSDEKELAEHVMLVDLGRNDVRRVSQPGSVEVEDFMSVVQYSHVQHIESTVVGVLAEDGRAYDAFDATRAVFPAGTLSGAPKIRAMEIVDELEAEPRGFYGGGVGYYSWTGDADLAIAIRTAAFERTGERRYDMEVQAGAGVVYDSRPEREYRETEDKMDALKTALELAREGR